MSDSLNLVLRPDLDEPYNYTLQVNETVLMYIEEGLFARIKAVKVDIAKHDNCEENRCLVQEQLYHDGRSEYKGATCDEDLMFLHGVLAQLYDVRNQSIWVRNNPGEHGWNITKPQPLPEEAPLEDWERDLINSNDPLNTQNKTLGEWQDEHTTLEKTEPNNFATPTPPNGFTAYMQKPESDGQQDFTEDATKSNG